LCYADGDEKHVSNVYSENLKGTNQLENLFTDGKIILKCNLRVGTGFKW
jgi:hypothetical protein